MLKDTKYLSVRTRCGVGFAAFLSKRPLLVGEVASVGHVLGEDLPGAVPGRAQRLRSLDILLLQRAQQQGVRAL